MNHKGLSFAIAIIIFCAVGFGAYIFSCHNTGCPAFFGNNTSSSGVHSFDDCVKLGLPIQESYPRTCQANGATFTEKISEGSIKIFFVNTNKDTDTKDCAQMHEVSRTVPLNDVTPLSAMVQLLAGPRPAEQDQGYSTAIPEKTTIQKFLLEKNILYVDFSDDINKHGGGDCRTTALRAQISQTMLQFPDIRDIVISVDGKIQDALQP